MATYKEIVSETGKLIEQCRIADLLTELWKGVQWVAHKNQQDNTEAALALTGEAAIHLYPALLKSPKAGERVLQEFGKYLLHKTGASGTEIWTKKLDVPEQEHIDMAAAKITDPELRTTCTKYKDLLDRAYPNKGHSVDRLVFINVANALLRHNIPYRDSVGVDIKTWGPTTEYCHRKKYHSLIPLVSAYAPSDVYNDFGAAFAAMVISNLRDVKDHSVAYALRGMVQRVAKMAAPPT